MPTDGPRWPKRARRTSATPTITVHGCAAITADKRRPTKYPSPPVALHGIALMIRRVVIVCCAHGCFSDFDPSVAPSSRPLILMCAAMLAHVSRRVRFRPHSCGGRSRHRYGEDCSEAAVGSRPSHRRLLRRILGRRSRRDSVAWAAGPIRGIDNMRWPVAFVQVCDNPLRIPSGRR